MLEKISNSVETQLSVVTVKAIGEVATKTTQAKVLPTTHTLQEEIIYLTPNDQLIMPHFGSILDRCETVRY